MSKPFKPRKAKPKMVSQDNMRSVRINANTVILAPASLTDEEARNRFLMRYKSGNKPPETYMPPVIKQEIAKVECMGSLEQLEAMVDETMKPEIE